MEVTFAGEVLHEGTPEKKVAAIFVDSAFGAPIVERLRTLDFDHVHEVSLGGPSPITTMRTGVRISSVR
jgi:hypothetical protein